MTKDSISDHLLELRSRLLKVVIFFIVLIIAGIPFASEIYAFVAAPMISLLPDGSSMIATQVTSPFMAPIKLVLYVALLFSMPWLFYQAWMYISPGLSVEGNSPRHTIATSCDLALIIAFLKSSL